jgi:hypothetical protein
MKRTARACQAVSEEEYDCVRIKYFQENCMGCAPVDQKIFFEELFARGRAETLIALAEEILKPKGGFLFDGYKLEATAYCRKPLA